MRDEVLVMDVELECSTSFVSELVVIDVPIHHICGCKSKDDCIRFVEDVLWLASALFIIVFGDLHTNFFSVLAFDSRIHRLALYMGMCSVLWSFHHLMNSTAVEVTVTRGATTREWRKLRVATEVVAMFWAMLAASMSFILISYAVWPIWSFLSIPMLFTLLKTTLVLLSYVLGALIKKFGHKYEY